MDEQEAAWRAWRDEHPAGLYNVPYVVFNAGFVAGAEWAQEEAAKDVDRSSGSVVSRNRRRLNYGKEGN